MHPDDQLHPEHTAMGRGSLATDIGDVQLGRVLKQSHAITVIEGHLIADRRRVVVKAFSDTTLRAHEEEILGRLASDRVPEVLGHARYAGKDALVLGWVDGVSLTTWREARAGKADADALEVLLERVIEALEAIHAAGVVHADLKPEHVLVGADQSVALIDFSGAVDVEQSIRAIHHITAETAAPEQLRGEPVDPRTDIHGFGLVLFWLLTGRYPRDHMKPATTAHPTGTALSLAERCLQPDPSRRPASLGQLRSELGKVDLGVPIAPAAEAIPDTTFFRERLPGVLPTPPKVEQESKQPQRSSVVARWVLAVALFAVSAAAAGWYGLIFYERYYKLDWTVDAAGTGDAVTVADVLERGGDKLVISLDAGRYKLPAISGREVLIQARPDLGAVPVIYSEDAPCVELANATVGLVGLVLEGAGVPEDRGCIETLGGALTLSGIRVLASGGTGLVAGQGSRLQIDTLQIAGAKGDGLHLLGGAQAAVGALSVEEVSGMGLVLTEGARVDAGELAITRTGAAGIGAGSGAGLIARKVAIEGTVGSAVEITEGASVTMVNTTVDAAGGAGVAVYDGGRLSLASSMITNGGLSGLFVDGARSVDLVDVVISGNGEHGAVLVSLEGGALRSVKIEGNKGAGLAVFPEVSLEMTDTTVEKNGAGDILDGREPEAPKTDEEPPE